MTNRSVTPAGKRARYRTGAALLALMLPAMAALPAMAQDKPAADNGQLAEVVVTARYTQENLQRTPLAITAVTAAQLETRALTNVTDLGAAVPNLFIHPGDAAEGLTPTIVLRGVSSGDYNFTWEPAVGIYIDDVYHNTLFGSALDLMDLDRVEVLRGPQGTLFGNASIGGAIRLFSKIPKGGDTGYAEVTYGAYNRVDVKAGFDTSIIPDKLFMRVSGVAKRQDGYVDQLDFTCEMKAQGTPQLAGSFPLSDLSASQRGCKIGSFGGTSLEAGKVMLRYIASPKLEINASGSYSNENDEVTPEVLLDAHPPAADNFVSIYNDELFAKYGIRYSNVFLPPPGRPYSSYASFVQPLSGLSLKNQNAQHSADGSLKVDYDLTDDIHVKAIGAYSDYGGVYTQNPDLSPLALGEAYGTFDVKQWTGELDITGKAFGGKLDWAAGGFILGADEHLGGEISFVLLNFSVNDTVHAHNKSAFVHGVYHVTDKLSLTAGVRYSSADKSYLYDHPGLLEIATPFDASANRADWLAGVDYQVTDDVMVYAKAATGSRPPGVFARPLSQYQLSAFTAEELTSYEGGFKAEFLDRRLRLNVAAYYSDYNKHLTDVEGFECLGQAPPKTPVLLASACPPGGAINWGFEVTTPASDKGVEVEATAEPVEGLLFNLNVGYNHYEAGVKTPGTPGYVFPGNLPQPEWNASAGVQYDLHVLNGALTPRLDWVYQSTQTYNPTPAATAPLPQDEVPGHSIFNARLSFRPGDSKWSGALSVTNLFNKYYYYGLFPFSGFDAAANLAPPREWAVTLRRDF